MNAFTNYLEKLGSNFLVSAMVPSLTLVIISILVFDPIHNISAIFKEPQGGYKLVGFGPIIFIATVIIGFTLTSLNTYILKIFEGYVTPFPIRFLYTIQKRAHEHKAGNLMALRDNLKGKILHLEESYEHTPEVLEELEQLRDEYYKVASDYDLIYPQDLADILPTRFGNTLKAAENYTGERYGFDGVHFWPRIVQVMPSDYRTSIDAVRNELSFLVNMSVLSAVFSVLCVIVIFYCMWLTNVATSNPTNFLAFFYNAFPYFIALLVGLISAGFFYNASLFSVGSFGLMIRSSYDLFRLDLLKKLGLERPKDSAEEFDTWYTLNELIVLGGHSLNFKKLDYREKD